MTKLKLYLTDDELVPVRVIRMALERAGYAVECFHNGLDTLERIRQVQPDALITDIEMPVMTGETLCKAIAEEFPDRSFPIFVVTGVTDLVHRSWSRQIPALSFIEKPISVRHLVEQLRQVLQNPSTDEASNDA
jgi:twitching motility two-component system response regulator PilG